MADPVTSEKSATLETKLKTDSGFRSHSKGDRISVDQWTAIQHIIHGGDAYLAMHAALNRCLKARI